MGLSFNLSRTLPHGLLFSPGNGSSVAQHTVCATSEAYDTLPSAVVGPDILVIFPSL